MSISATLSTIGNGPVADYSSPISWEAGETTPGLLPIGVVTPVPRLVDDLTRFIAEARAVPTDFALFHSSGEPIIWKFEGDVRSSDIPLPAVMRRSSLSPQRLLRAMRNFVNAELRSRVDVYSPTFRSHNLDEALVVSQDALSELNTQLLQYLAIHSADIDRLSWRDLEEVVGEIFRRQGFRVEIGPGTGDEGVDLRLFMVVGAIELPFLVQVKKYSDSNPVTLQPVQALYGAVAAEGAVGGILVTSGRFLPGARSWADRVAHRLTLAARNELEKWLRDVANV